MADLYTNPTTINQSTKDFGAGQFAVEPYMQPFPFEGQKTENQQYNTDFTTFLQGLETPQQTREKFENRYGYQDLKENYFRTQEAAGDVMNAIKAVPENVKQRGSETIMTQGQLAGVVNKEVGDLMKTYTELSDIGESMGRRLAATEQNLNQAAALEMAQQQKMMTPWLQKYEDKNILQARQYSGWTFASQLELNRLLANQQAGFQWTNSEANRAQELSLMEKNFQNSLEMLEKQNEVYLDLWG